MKFVTLALAVVLFSSIIVGAYTVSVGQGASKNSPQQSIANNLATSVTSNDTFTTEQPPLPTNGSIPQATVACNNFSVPFKSQYYFVTKTTTTSVNSSVEGITIKVLCNGCGINYDNSSYTVIPRNTSVQWQGSYGDGNGTQYVNGICDAAFGLGRMYPSAWNVLWSFQRLSTTGTLEVIVSLDSNGTVVFDKTAPANSNSNIVSGSLSIPEGS